MSELLPFVPLHVGNGDRHSFGAVVQPHDGDKPGPASTPNSGIRRAPASVDAAAAAAAVSSPPWHVSSSSRRCKSPSPAPSAPKPVQAKRRRLFRLVLADAERCRFGLQGFELGLERRRGGVRLLCLFRGVLYYVGPIGLSSTW